MKVKQEGAPLHLGAGPEKTKMSPFKEGLERVLSKVEDIVNRGADILLMQNKNDKKFEEALSRVDFEYVTLLLKKLLRKVSQVEENYNPEDFYLDKNSVYFNKDISHLGQAFVDRNILQVNFNQMVKAGGKEFSDEDRYILVELVSTIIHEAVHLLAKKEEGQEIATGFELRKKQNESLNEGMTEIIARGLARSYFDFKRDFTGDIMSANAYEDERKRLFALMILVARDTGVSLEAVIQSFTVSYFHGDDVLSTLPELAGVSGEAKELIRVLRKPVPKSKKEYIPFSEEELGNNQEAKEILSAIYDSSPSRVIAQALKL